MSDSTNADGAPSEHEDNELLPARMLNEFVYCPRLFHLEWVQQEWAESADTAAGRHDHRRVDREVGDLPPAAELAGGNGEARSVTLSSREAGIVAKLDLIEVQDGKVVPVDYKHGKPPGAGHGAPIWDTDRIQLGAQALLLIENGYPCEEAIAYYVGSRTRVRLPVDEALLDEVREVARAARAAAADPAPPPPLQDSPKCPRCSLAGICLPDESRALTSDDASPQVRMLYPARDDALPLHVQAQGARVGKSGQELEIVERDGSKHRIRLLDVSQLALFGSVQITSAALGVLLRRGVPVCHFSYGGWFQGITHGIGPRNCHARVHQFRLAEDPERRLALARGFVERKIRNCRTLLRRNASEPEEDALTALNRFADSAQRAQSAESLLGHEGAAARTYFGAFSSMLKSASPDDLPFEFNSRNRRPPRDPINALLSLAYSALAKDWTVVLLSVGLDPFLGFYHRPRHGRAALALDLMEEFRPLIADSVVLQCVNNGEIAPRDFIRRGSAVSLTDEARKKFFQAYERRMSHLVRHPLFGYRVSYRRLLEVQARLFARHLTGELPTYDGFRTR